MSLFDWFYPQSDQRSLLDFAKLLLLFQVLWFGLWGVALVLFKNEPRFNEDTKNRLVSIVHGLGSFILSCVDIFYYNAEIRNQNTIFENSALLFSISYFIYDWIGCWMIDMASKDLVLHHGVTLLGLSSCLYTGSGGAYAYFGVFLTEISNLPMHLRKIIANMGLRDTLMFEVLEVVYFILYAAARGILGPYAVYLAAVNINYVPKAILLVALLIVGQSIAFVKTMGTIVKRKYSNYKERKENNVRLFWFEVNPAVKELEYTQNEVSDNLF